MSNSSGNDNNQQNSNPSNETNNILIEENMPQGQQQNNNTHDIVSMSIGDNNTMKISKYSKKNNIEHPSKNKVIDNNYFKESKYMNSKFTKQLADQYNSQKHYNNKSANKKNTLSQSQKVAKNFINHNIVQTNKTTSTKLTSTEQQNQKQQVAIKLTPVINDLIIDSVGQTTYLLQGSDVMIVQDEHKNNEIVLSDGYNTFYTNITNVAIKNNQLLMTMEDCQKLNKKIKETLGYELSIGSTTAKIKPETGSIILLQDKKNVKYKDHDYLLLGYNIEYDNKTGKITKINYLLMDNTKNKNIPLSLLSYDVNTKKIDEKKFEYKATSIAAASNSQLVTIKIPNSVELDHEHRLVDFLILDNKAPIISSKSVSIKKPLYDGETLSENDAAEHAKSLSKQLSEEKNMSEIKIKDWTSIHVPMNEETDITDKATNKERHYKKLADNTYFSLLCDNDLIVDDELFIYDKTNKTLTPLNKDTIQIQIIGDTLLVNNGEDNKNLTDLSSTLNEFGFKLVDNTIVSTQTPININEYKSIDDNTYRANKINSTITDVGNGKYIEYINSEYYNAHIDDNDVYTSNTDVNQSSDGSVEYAVNNNRSECIYQGKKLSCIVEKRSLSICVNDTEDGTTKQYIVHISHKNNGQSYITAETLEEINDFLADYGCTYYPDTGITSFLSTVEAEEFGDDMTPLDAEKKIYVLYQKEGLIAVGQKGNDNAYLAKRDQSTGKYRMYGKLKDLCNIIPHEVIVNKNTIKQAYVNKKSDDLQQTMDDILCNLEIPYTKAERLQHKITMRRYDGKIIEITFNNNNTKIVDITFDGKQFNINNKEIKLNELLSEPYESSDELLHVNIDATLLAIPELRNMFLFTVNNNGEKIFNKNIIDISNLLVKDEQLITDIENDDVQYKPLIKLTDDNFLACNVEGSVFLVDKTNGSSYKIQDLTYDFDNQQLLANPNDNQNAIRLNKSNNLHLVLSEGRKPVIVLTLPNDKLPNENTQQQYHFKKDKTFTHCFLPLSKDLPTQLTNLLQNWKPKSLIDTSSEKNEIIKNKTLVLKQEKDNVINVENVLAPFKCRYVYDYPQQPSGRTIALFYNNQFVCFIKKIQEVNVDGESVDLATFDQQQFFNKGFKVKDGKIVNTKTYIVKNPNCKLPNGKTLEQVLMGYNNDFDGTKCKIITRPNGETQLELTTNDCKLKEIQQNCGVKAFMINNNNECVFATNQEYVHRNDSKKAKYILTQDSDDKRLDRISILIKNPDAFEPSRKIGYINSKYFNQDLLPLEKIQFSRNNVQAIRAEMKKAIDGQKAREQSIESIINAILSIYYEYLQNLTYNDFIDDFQNLQPGQQKEAKQIIDGEIQKTLQQTIDDVANDRNFSATYQEVRDFNFENYILKFVKERGIIDETVNTILSGWQAAQQQQPIPPLSQKNNDDDSKDTGASFTELDKNGPKIDTDFNSEKTAEDEDFDNNDNDDNTDEDEKENTFDGNGRKNDNLDDPYKGNRLDHNRNQNEDNIRDNQNRYGQRTNQNEYDIRDNRNSRYDQRARTAINSQNSNYRSNPNESTFSKRNNFTKNSRTNALQAGTNNTSASVYTQISSTRGLSPDGKSGVSTYISQQNPITVSGNNNGADNNNSQNSEESANKEDEPTWTVTIAFGTLATLTAGATLVMKFAIDTKIGTIIGGVFAGACGLVAVIAGVITYNKKSDIENNESQTSLDSQNQEAAPTVGQ